MNHKKYTTPPPNNCKKPAYYEELVKRENSLSPRLYRFLLHTLYIVFWGSNNPVYRFVSNRYTQYLW